MVKKKKEKIIMLYFLLYPISVLLLLGSFLLKTLIIDESPPSFTVNEMRDFYISSILMLMFYLFTIKSGSKSLIKLFIALLPVLIMLIFQGIIIFKIITYQTNYIISIILMDLTYELVLLILFIYGIYTIKKRIYKKEVV